MKYWKTTSGAVGFAMLSAALVLASSDDLTAPAPANPGTSAMTVVQSDPHVEERFTKIQQRGAKESTRKRVKADQKITAAIQTVSNREARDGADRIADRIASEFR